MLSFREAEHVAVCAIPVEAVSALAEIQLVAVAEKPMRHVVVAAAARAFERHLVRPAPVDGAFG